MFGGLALLVRCLPLHFLKYSFIHLFAVRSTCYTPTHGALNRYIVGLPKSPLVEVECIVDIIGSVLYLKALSQQGVAFSAPQSGDFLLPPPYPSICQITPQLNSRKRIYCIFALNIGG